MLSKHHIVNWLLDCEHIFTEQRDYLTALDTDIGDGDHGLNMQRGFTKVAEKLPAVADKDIGQVLTTTGMTLLSSVGGASGPLYGTFFIRAAASTDACQSLTLSQLGKMLADGVEVAGATMENGLLHIDLQRSAPETVVQTIAINAGRIGRK